MEIKSYLRANILLVLVGKGASMIGWRKKWRMTFYRQAYDVQKMNARRTKSALQIEDIK